MAGGVVRPPFRAAVGAIISMLMITACTSSSAVENASVSESAEPGATTIAMGNATSSGAPVAPPTTSSPTTTTVLATTTTSTTTTTTTTTTIPHGNGPVMMTPLGVPIDVVVSATAKQIYDAAVVRDYDRIKAIIGKRRFRWGFVGQRRPAEQWQKEFDEGRTDALVRMIALLDLPPAVDQRGNTVWPYLATKAPAEWNEQDLNVLTSLGFSPEDVAATKLKGIYKDFRLVIDPQGIWTAFGLGY